MEKFEQLSMSMDALAKSEASYWEIFLECSEDQAFNREQIEALRNIIEKQMYLPQVRELFRARIMNIDTMIRKSKLEHTHPSSITYGDSVMFYLCLTHRELGLYDKAFNVYMSSIENLIYKHASQSMVSLNDLEDLKQNVAVFIAENIQNYNPDKEVRLVTWLDNNIRDIAIKMKEGNQGLTKHAINIRSKIHKAKESLEKKGVLNPTQTQLAAEINLTGKTKYSPSQVEKAMKNNYAVFSYDQQRERAMEHDDPEVDFADSTALTPAQVYEAQETVREARAYFYNAVKAFGEDGIRVINSILEVYARGNVGTTYPSSEKVHQDLSDQGYKHFEEMSAEDFKKFYTKIIKNLESVKKTSRRNHKGDPRPKKKTFNGFVTKDDPSIAEDEEAFLNNLDVLESANAQN